MTQVAISPTAPASVTARRKKRFWFAVCSVAVLMLVGVAFWFIETNWPYRYRKIHPLLEDVFASQVKIAQYHRTYFPNPGFMAVGLTLRRKSAPDAPPIGTVQEMLVQGSWIDLLMLRRRVQQVEITGLHVVLPPAGSRASQEHFPPGSSSDFGGPDTAIGRMVIRDSLLDIQRTDGPPLSFPVRELAFTNVLKGQPAGYTVDMQNALPAAQIRATGSFGPVNAQNLGDTPVSGNFALSALRLHDVGEISGHTSATGHFRGPLAAIEAAADSHTPDFAVEDAKASPVAATIECTVNGVDWRRGDPRDRSEDGCNHDPCSRQRSGIAARVA